MQAPVLSAQRVPRASLILLAHGTCAQFMSLIELGLLVSTSKPNSINVVQLHLHMTFEGNTPSIAGASVPETVVFEALRPWSALHFNEDCVDPSGRSP